MALLHVVDSGVPVESSYCNLVALDPQSGVEAVKVNL